MAVGNTEILEIGHIDRGYEAIEDKFNSIGANMRRIRI
jgi:UDP-N-acetylglucosamine 1-carboxyvinyltransferase